MKLRWLQSGRPFDAKPSEGSFFMITIAYHDSSGETEKQERWADRLGHRLGQVRLVALTSAEAEDADIALVWSPPHGRLRRLGALKLIVSLGQGVDHLFSDPDLPDDVPVVRLVDPNMSHALSQWVILTVLDYLRDGPAYRQAATQRRFASLPQRHTEGLPVAVYGLGAIGTVIADRLAALGFAVHGWSRSPREQAGPVKTHHGDEGFSQMLSACKIHVCILPLTAETEGLFSARRFAEMPAGSYFINGGRGRQVIEADLLAAIRSGHLDGAALDVFVNEPLPQAHPFWTEPRISVWPHVAAQTNPDTAADQVARAIQVVLSGAKPENMVNKAKGY